jgi:sugar lactone lactonase YvrE
MYRLGGSVAGLAADGLVLRNGGSALAIEKRATSFTMPLAVPAHSAYDLQVLEQPFGQSCSVAAGSGVMPAADMFNAVVTCATLTHRVGGSIIGLTHDGLVLANGADTLPVAASDNAFMLPSPVAEGSSYDVVVRAQPVGQSCAVTGGRGQMGSTDAVSVQIRCSAQPYSLGGSVSGLSQPGLVLINGSDVLSVGPGASRFGFAIGLPYGQPYAVTVQAQPAGLYCSVSAGAGIMGPQDVDNVAVTCAPMSFTLGGHVTGLTLEGLVLANGADTLAVPAQAARFTMPTRVAFGGSYALTVNTHPAGLTCSIAAGTGTMGAADVTTPVVTCAANSYTLGGTVSGLTSGGLVLANGTDSLSLAAHASRFTMPYAVAFGSGYAVTVAAQPTGQNCSVSASSGTMGAGAVQDVIVTCSTVAYPLGGTVNGLIAHGLVLANGSDTLAVPAGATGFTLGAPVAYGGAYAITVQAHPPGLNCSVLGGSGTMGVAAVGSVLVDCVPIAYPLGGTISGLSAPGLVLASGADTLAVPANAATFTMDNPVAFGSVYAVTVLTQPTGQTCSVSSGTATMSVGGASNVTVTCASNAYTLGGTISGLGSTGLVLANGTDTLVVPSNATAFTMGSAVAYGGSYAVTVHTQPIGLTCSVAGGAATMGAAPVVDVALTCAPNAYSLGGSISGLSNSGLVLANAGDTLSVPALSGSFTMAAAVAYGGTYTLSVATQPRWLQCTVANGSGTMGPAPVADAAVSCSASVHVTTLAGTGSTGFADGAAAAASFRRPTGVARDAAGNLYVADMDNHSIRRISAAGQVTTLAGSGVAGHADGTGTAATFNLPFHVALDSVGNLYVADSGNHMIRKVSPGGVVSTLAGTGVLGSANGPGASAQFSSPAGVAVDAAGTVYVADTGNHVIRRIAADGTVSTLAGLAGNPGSTDGVSTVARFAVPNGLAVDAAGNVYVADSNNSRIRKISAAGVVSTLAGAGTTGAADGDAGTAQFFNPMEVAVDVDGYVYVTDAWNQKIRRISPSGQVSTLAGTGVAGYVDGTNANARFAYPFGITLANDGSLYIADTYNHRIRRIANAP